ncbi:hypothetical protein HGD85_03615, partial [Rhodobacteraceae bacterium R_SAG10]|nr:hypothetical protein [Rhodobacteraceae bacterium R_SAG10]
AHQGWTDQGHAWWEVGTPHISTSDKVAAAHKDIEATRTKQRQGI